ncbi:hypothetical protein EON64_04225 [archaeon]|nr:MAG: hypothetical protein EON64_04225 [archaeon]
MNHNQTGFKKLMHDHQAGIDNKKNRHVYVKSYAERKAERQRAEKGKLVVPPLASQSTGLTSPDAKVRFAEDTTFSTQTVKLPAIQTLSAAERENYFGMEARSTFFDYYRQLTVQHNNSHIGGSSAVNTARTESSRTSNFEPFSAQNTAREENNSSSFCEATNRSVSPLLQEHSKSNSMVGIEFKRAASYAAKLVTAMTDLPASPGSSSARLNSARGASRESNGNNDVPSGSVEMIRETYSRLRPRATAPSKDERQLLLDHLFAIDPLEQRTDRPPSARTKYLKGCLERNVLPRPALILRKEHTSFLNLASFGMGNELAVILAEALDSVPLLEGLSIADNNLDDRGLVPIVNKLSDCKVLKLFDLSNNKVDSETADALRRFISSSACQLTVLKMQNANVDDYEAFHFMEVSSYNFFDTHDRIVTFAYYLLIGHCDPQYCRGSGSVPQPAGLT